MAKKPRIEAERRNAGELEKYIPKYFEIFQQHDGHYYFVVPRLIKADHDVLCGPYAKKLLAEMDMANVRPH